MRILVTDDERDIRQVLRLLLENSGYEVIEASNGAMAVDIIMELITFPEKHLPHLSTFRFRFLRDACSSWETTDRNPTIHVRSDV